MTILTITEASQATGIARSTLYGYIQRGKLNITSHPRGGRGVDTVELQRVFGPLKQTTTPQEEPAEHTGTTKKTGTAKKTRTVKKKVDTPQENNETVKLLHQQIDLLGLLKQELTNIKERLELLEQRPSEPPRELPEESPEEPSKGKRRKGRKGRKKGR